ncbi:alpha/beta hydrolase [Bacillus infantis]|uniref:alpha/beta hydrolase n=1 Tax=Bacillus infantis TaxID=324767 RepID=UPI0021CC782F|nr:alpha/beta hydrolase [Bacillus infantis]
MSESILIPWKDMHLCGSLDFPAGFSKNRRYPLVIICHGFTGSRIGVDRLFVKTSNRLTADGYLVLRFDYEGCGESPGEYGETGLPDLLEQTLSAVDFAMKLEYADPHSISLIGHSLGGAVAVLAAAKDDRIRKLIIWSASAKPYQDIVSIVGSEKIKALDKGASLDYLGYQLTEKYFSSLKRYEPLDELAAYRSDVLIVHGTADQDIPVSHSGRYAEEFRKRKEGSCSLHYVTGACHTYSAGRCFAELIECTSEWLNAFREQQSYASS